MMHDGHDTQADARKMLYILLAGAEGGGPTARAARLARDDELAEFLCRTQGKIVGEAERLLAERPVE